MSTEDSSLTKRDRQRERRREKQEVAIRELAAKRRRRTVYIFSILGVLAAVIILVIFLVQQFGDDVADDFAEIAEEAVESATTTTAADTAPTTTTEGGSQVVEYGTGPCPPDEVPEVPVTEFDGAPQLCLDPEKEYEAVFTTSEGVIRVRLDTDRTPLTANNFYVLAKYGYYNGTLLFRTDPSIGIIQGGSPHTNSPSDQGPGYNIPDEGGRFEYEPGQLVMARRAGPNGASAQFFFAVNEETALLNPQGTFVVFGQTVDEDLGVLTSILDLHQDDPTSQLGGGPSREVRVETVEIREVGAG